MSNQLIPVKQFDIATVPAMYKCESKKFIDYVKEHGFSIESYQSFILSLNDEYKAQTVNKYVAACRSLIRSLFDSPYLTELQKYQLQKALDTVKYVKLGASEKQVQSVLSPDELQTLIDTSPKRTAKMVEFMAVTGCRVSELTGVRLDKCTEDGNRVLIQVIGKGNKARTLRIPIKLYNDIRIVFNGNLFLFESRTGNPLNTRNIYKEVVRLSLKHLNKKVTPHDFRHYFATRQGIKTGNWKGISDYLGHSTVQTTLDMYIHSALSDTDLGIE